MKAPVFNLKIARNNNDTLRHRMKIYGTDLVAQIAGYSLTMFKSNFFKFPVQFALLISMLWWNCSKMKSQGETAVSFADVPLAQKIDPGVIDEASGIADSKANPGYLWVEQDSGNPNDIFLLSHTGTILKKINIRASVNRDWEDIALGNGPGAGKKYLYVADIGDNSKVFTQYIIYRFEEPLATIDTLSTYDEIKFQYPDGSHDAEAILVDNASKDIYIITKQDATSRIYKLGYPQNTATINMAAYIGSLSFTGVVSAACSATNDELLLKTYTSLYYWKRNVTESIEQTLSKNPVMLGYQQEPQGEAICFKNDNSGFYTLSERPSIIPFVNLNYYKRK